MTTYHITTEDKESIIDMLGGIGAVCKVIGMVDAATVIEVELTDVAGGVTDAYLKEHPELKSTISTTNPFDPPQQHGGALIGFQFKTHGKEDKKDQGANDRRALPTDTNG